MNKVEFIKMNGAGNDFVMIDNRNLQYQFAKEQIEGLCDRHRGIGADGLIMVEPAQTDAQVRMRYYNADGGEAEMCGNGARCFGKFTQKLLGVKEGESIKFDTMAGKLSACFVGEEVQIWMSDPVDFKMNQKLNVDGQMLDVSSVNTGVPHAVIFVEDLAGVEVVKWGRELRYHEAFAPKGTNVNFVKIIRPGQIEIRTYERGVEDETLACGTGMVACALMTVIQQGWSLPVKVKVKGGDVLTIGGKNKGDLNFNEVTLTGPADLVFKGEVEI